MTFDADETGRYARQLVLKGFGGAAQQRLKAARIAIVGAGALGSPVIAYLAAAGVGHMRVIDNDSVALTNLHRQILYTEADICSGKAERAAAFVAARNHHVVFDACSIRLTQESAAPVLAGHDLVIDGSDSLSTRRLVADASAALHIPLVSGAVSMFDGQVTCLMPGDDNPRFSDIYPDVSEDTDLPSCEAVGVLGATTGVIGTLMANEAIKVLTGTGEPLVGRLLVYDGRATRFTEMRYRRG